MTRPNRSARTNLPRTNLLDSAELQRLDPDFLLGMVLHHDASDDTPPLEAQWRDTPVAAVHSLHGADNLHWPQTPATGQRRAVAEVWHTEQAVSRSRSGDWHLACTDQFLFATAHYRDNGSDISELTRQHYLQLFAIVRQYDCQSMLRIWNYVPAINQPDQQGQERYRSFCLGRALAFSEHFRAQDELAMPAATGIGSLSGDITIALLGLRGRRASVVHLENPRQVPAYRYPPRYGPRSPSFARATCLSSDTARQLYVSGTSAVRGSETVFCGNTEKQLQETLENISALIAADNLRKHGIECAAPATGYSLTDFSTVKVYFRHATDLPLLRRHCQRAFGSRARIAYLLSEICRADLAVEIEGVINSGLITRADSLASARTDVPSLARP